MAADRNDPPRPASDGDAYDGDETDRYNFEWPDEPGVFEVYDQAAEDRALARAEEDIAAGRVVRHEKAAEWLRTWGTPGSKPYPREWFE